MFWLGFFIGAIVGAFVGILTIALVSANSKGDCYDEQFRRQNQ